jgi:glycosyltransferase involved in cell wall biosynthesis
MKILHLLGSSSVPENPDTNGISGVVRVALELARIQARNGHQVFVGNVGKNSRRSSWEGVNLLRMSSLPWAYLQVADMAFDLRIHAPFIFLTYKEQFDVIHGHQYHYLRFLHSKIRIAHFHSDPFHKGDGSTALSGKDFALIAKTSDAQVAVSGFIADQAKQGLGSRGSVYTIPNGVDLDRFSRKRWRVERRHWREKWNSKDKEIVFLCVGAIVPEKGILHLVNAFCRLCNRTSHVHLVLAGSRDLWAGPTSNMAPDPYETQVVSTITRADRESKIHFLGKISSASMPGVYAASDVLIVPSIWEEAFSLVALEGLASGLPVIASQVGGIPEIVSRENGILVPPADERSLEKTMYLLAKDDHLRDGLSQAARKTALPLTWEVAARKIDQVYLGCLQSKGFHGN